MKKSYLLTLALLAVGASAQQAGDKSYFAIFAETKSMRVMGQPVHKMPANLPPGFKLPAQAKAFMGVPTRLLTVRLYSPTIAPDSATAYVVPPAGLQQGDKLDLDLFRPKPATAGGGGGGEGGNSNPEQQNLVIKIYWGSSDTVQSGQPKVFDFSTMSMEQKMQAGKRMQAMGSLMSSMGGAHGAVGGNYFYKDGWTTGYWPTESQPGEIADGAALPGTYTLTTNFAGNVSIDAPSDVDFLAPIEMTSPDMSQKPNMDNALPFQWNSIPNALGEFATMVGFEKGNGTNTLILWSSSQVFVDQLLGDLDYPQMSEVKDFVDKTIFMPGSTNSMTVPAGIFKDCQGAFLSMVGYGPGTAKDDGTPVPRIQTRTTLNIIFPGKKGMDGGGGRPGGGGDGGG